METSVATLLLITSAVVFACVVVNYAVSVMEQFLDADNLPQLNALKTFESNLLDQTNNMLNQTMPQMPSEPPP